MEIILILTGILIITAFIFIIIEYPYYLVSVFIFLHLYNFNFELPGPLDLRGLISVVLLLRLVIFDKENLHTILESITNKYFIIIILFSFYAILIDISSGISLMKSFKLFVLNFSALLIGFITTLNGFGKRTIVLAILITGLAATGDLIYSFSIFGNIKVVRIIEYKFLGRTFFAYNHNFFGGLVGYALITTFLMLIAKESNKLISYILLIIYILGVIISTSRMTFISVFVTSIIILFTQHKLNFNFKKLIMIFFSGIFFLIILGFSYKYIMSAINMDSKLADQIYYRTIEEPLSFFDDDITLYDKKGIEKRSSVKWRINKTLRDSEVLLNQDIPSVLFGHGLGGYSEIGALEFRGNVGKRYAAHNFYTNFVSERGIIGIFLFMSFVLTLLYTGIKMVKEGRIKFSLVYLLLLLFVNSIGAVVSLNNEFGYVLYGSIIADIFQSTNIENQEIEVCY